MRLLRHTFILNLLVITALLGAGFFSYRAFESYKTIQDAQKRVDLPSFIAKLTALADTVSDEMLESTSYLVKKNKQTLKHVLQAREKTDTLLHEIYVQIETELTLYPLQNRISTISHALQQARQDTDALPGNIIESLFTFYYLGVSVPIADMTKNLAQLPAFKKESSMLQIYAKLMELKSHTAFENCMVYTLLLQKHPMSSKEKQIFEQIITKDTLPLYKNYLDQTLSAYLESKLPIGAYHRYLNELRQDIIAASDTGKYPVDIVLWLEQIKRKQNALTEVEKSLRSKMTESPTDHTLTLWLPLFAYLGGTLFLLYIMVKLILFRNTQIKNRKLYDDTLREIELVFDQEQQKKLKRLVEQGNIDLIYRFLLQAIKDANHTKDLFLANMSHEIRTPLNGIVGFTQLLQETETTQEQEEFLTIVAKSSEHLLKIVNDVLDLAKIKAQKIEFESITFDPLEHFETAVESYAGKAHKENIDLNVFIDPHLPTALVGDPTKISQILVNLLSNAIKFTPKNGEVNVTIEKRSESDKEVEVYFAVSDTGIGITKEQRKKIFQAFSQADVSTSRKYGGTGLGLSISGRLIDLMGGKLSIRSIPHEGSTFHFTLTLKKDSSAQNRVVERMDGMRIGILDPHIELQYYPNKNLATYLGFAGADIIHYTDRSIIAAKERGELPDVLFIDHKFRQRDKEIEPFLALDTRIILLTTGDQKRALKRYEGKIDRLLYKPVTFTKTFKVLNRSNDIQEAEQEIFFDNLHILVAEDNTINQQLITRVLQNIGVDVTLAANGLEAFELRKEKRFDMIFMDIEMPIMGGMEATAKILGHERSEHKRHIPIIALTANALSGDRAKYLGAGMDGYLSKPIELNAIRELLLSYFPDHVKEERAA